MKTKSERETETVASMKDALLSGCRLMDSHFKKIEIRPQDFDEDDDPTFRPDPIFEPFVSISVVLVDSIKRRIRVLSGNF